MDDSLSAWLAVREPADFAARSADLTRRLVARLPSLAPFRVVDLGTGTGSNVRYLIEHLPPVQEWILVDRDARLLSEAAERLAAWAAGRGYTVAHGERGVELTRGERHCRVTTHEADLGARENLAVVADRHLVTASALLDLVSEGWLSELASRCRAAGAAALFALTYNGESRCNPAEPEDDDIRRLLNRHQLRDKGFAPAAGPDAAAIAAHVFGAAGYDVERAEANWVLDEQSHELQRRLVHGWAEAAAELVPNATISSWLQRRLAMVADGRSRIVVGHEDLIAWPRAGVCY
jgi:hypothetical protein